MEIWDITKLGVQPHHPQVLRSDEGAARTVAISLPAGERLDDHEVHEHAWLHVHHGEVEVEADGTTVLLAPGGLAHFSPAERHEVRATDDALLILFLAPWPGEGHPSRRPTG